jgi:taurine dioxygenase
VVHPAVRTHPETGRKGLFVSEGFTTRIVGLPEDESQQLLAELYAHSVLPQNI